MGRKQTPEEKAGLPPPKKVDPPKRQRRMGDSFGFRRPPKPKPVRKPPVGIVTGFRKAPTDA